MASWLPPLVAASFAVLVLNIALFMQRRRQRTQHWPMRFLRDLRRWHGRLPDDLHY